MLSGLLLGRRDDIYQPEAAFAFDAQMQVIEAKHGARFARHAPRFDGRVMLGRRILEMATESALTKSPVMEGAGAWKGEWEKLRKVASSAQTPLHILCNYLRGGAATRGRELDRDEWMLGILTSYRQGDRVAALGDMADLLRTDRLLSGLETWAADKRVGIIGEDKGNSDTVLVEFVQRMGEAWLGLTGKLPSSSSGVAEPSPFLRFTLAAWNDMAPRDTAPPPGATTWAQGAVTHVHANLSRVPAERRAEYWPAWLSP